MCSFILPTLGGPLHPPGKCLSLPKGIFLPLFLQYFFPSIASISSFQILLSGFEPFGPLHLEISFYTSLTFCSSSWTFFPQLYLPDLHHSLHHDQFVKLFITFVVIFRNLNFQEFLFVWFISFSSSQLLYHGWKSLQILSKDSMRKIKK